VRCAVKAHIPKVAFQVNFHVENKHAEGVEQVLPSGLNLLQRMTNRCGNCATLQPPTGNSYGNEQGCITPIARAILN
jgi:hypothetical protein